MQPHLKGRILYGFGKIFAVFCLFALIASQTSNKHFVFSSSSFLNLWNFLYN
jgi:hypothetical protein